MPITIEFCSEGKAISDFETWMFTKNLSLDTMHDVSNSDRVIKVSTSIVIHSILFAVYKGRIPHEAIVFKYGEDILTIDKNSHISRRPRGFADMEMRFTQQMISHYHAQYQEQRKNIQKRLEKLTQRLGELTAEEIRSKMSEVHGGNTKVKLIKAIRLLVGFGCGLKEAKDWAEANELFLPTDKE